ncbi:MAG TPA: undecaprenyl-diphosphate phosphatase [Candidatus Nanoarchaeia archaeon]|nr:undecaprenyl-diphosphate phosphatase [Candidatus Nanoarchaeia archaeon]
MNLLEAVLLGVVQGITEWLPVSSSGHLVLLQNLFNIEQPVIFDLILHIGSLIVVLIVFRKSITELIRGILKGEKAHLRFLFQLILASIPIALVGILLNDFIKSIFNDTKTVGFSLLFTAMVLFLSKYPKIKDKALTYKNTFIIGIFQAIAILPGVSRSGSTLSAGLMQGVNKKDTARFSFLMFIPAILGATLFELKNVSQVTDMLALTIGTIAAIITGIASLKLLLYIINKGKLSYFGWYCLIVGLAILIPQYLA